MSRYPLGNMGARGTRCHAYRKVRNQGMPKKLQIKLLSQSAELLSITNCSAGQISVLRAESPSELRPYQRALTGSQGRERFVITVDGVEYRTEDHNLIGLGEVAPHSGMTVSQYLSSVGLLDGGISALLMSFGIEGIEQKLCSALSPDEERKVRLFAATADPAKVIVINEPFEPILSSWRERMAEFLTDFARAKNGLVIVTSLSYRPDSWIDNPAIARHQVGQSLRRTIGFGSGQSEDAQLLNQLRDQVRADQTVIAAPPTPPEQRPQAAAMSLGAAALMGANSAQQEGVPLDTETITQTTGLIHNARLVASLKAGAALGAGGLGVWAAVTLLGIYPITSAKAPSTEVKALAKSQAPAESSTATTKNGSSAQNEQSENTSKRASPPEIAKATYVLDNYSPAIRAALLDTSKGIMGDAALGGSIAPPPAQSNSQTNKEGNFYKLLESAGTDKDAAKDDGVSQKLDDAGSWQAPDTSDIEQEFNPSEEEQRREAIREKFLEAIRAAAERREQDGEG